MTPEPTPRRNGLVTIVLPAKNEESAIAKTLQSLPLGTLRAQGLDAEVVVLDGHSVDATAEIARRWGATVIPDIQPGKGRALRNARDRFRGDPVVMLDADGTYPPDAIPRLIAPILNGEADVVMGIREPLPGSMARLHKAGNILLSFAASLLAWHDCRDLCTGMWAFRADALRSLPLQSSGFGLEAELFMLTARRGFRIGTIDVDYLPRRGRAKLSLVKDGTRIWRRLFRSRLVPLDPWPTASTPKNAPAPAAGAGGGG